MHLYTSDDIHLCSLLSLIGEARGGQSTSAAFSAYEGDVALSSNLRRVKEEGRKDVYSSKDMLMAGMQDSPEGTPVMMRKGGSGE